MSKQLESLKSEKAKMEQDAIAQKKADQVRQKDEMMAVEVRIAKIKSDLAIKAKQAQQALIKKIEDESEAQKKAIQKEKDKAVAEESARQKKQIEEMMAQQQKMVQA